MRDATITWDDLQARAAALLHGAGKGPGEGPSSAALPGQELERERERERERGPEPGQRPFTLTVSFETMTRLKFAGSLEDRPERAKQQGSLGALRLAPCSLCANQRGCLQPRNPTGNYENSD